MTTLSSKAAEKKDTREEKEDYLYQIKDQVLAALKTLRDKQYLSALDDEQKRVLADFFIPLLIGLKRENDELLEEFSQKLGDKAQQAREAALHILTQAYEQFEATGEFISEDELKKRLNERIKLEEWDAAYHVTAYEHCDLAYRIAAETFIELCDRARVPLKTEHRTAFGDGLGSPSPGG